MGEHVQVDLPLVWVVLQVLKAELIVETKLLEGLGLGVAELSVYEQVAQECVADQHLADTDGTAPVHVGAVGNL